MITNVAELLTAIIEVERSELDKVKIPHGPTIGNMYEGLSQEVLQIGVPFQGLEVVKGFARRHDGTLTDELDCMLVTDKGELIPKTTLYIVPLEKVVGVVQVKKSLYRADVKDGFQNLRSVIAVRPAKSPDNSAFTLRRSFEQIARVPLPEDYKTLPPHLQWLYHQLLLEVSFPVRILLGYHGFKSEQTFRAGIIKLTHELCSSKERGWGPLSLPNFIIGPNAVAMKNNGMPWGTPLQGRVWPLILTSGRLSPIEVLLEAIWSRLNYMGVVDAINFGDDLKNEQWGQLIDVSMQDANRGEYDLWPAKLQDSGEPFREWQPVIVDKPTYELAERLCIVCPDPVRLSELDIPEIGKAAGALEEAVVAGRDTADQDLLHLLTDSCACVNLPDGRYAVGENSSGRLTRWIDRHYPDRKLDVVILRPKE